MHMALFCMFSSWFDFCLACMLQLAGVLGDEADDGGIYVDKMVRLYSCSLE